MSEILTTFNTRLEPYSFITGASSMNPSAWTYFPVIGSTFFSMSDFDKLYTAPPARKNTTAVKRIHILQFNRQAPKVTINIMAMASIIIGLIEQNSWASTTPAIYITENTTSGLFIRHPHLQVINHIQYYITCINLSNFEYYDFNVLDMTTISRNLLFSETFLIFIVSRNPFFNQNALPT